MRAAPETAAAEMKFRRSTRAAALALVLTQPFSATGAICCIFTKSEVKAEVKAALNRSWGLVEYPIALAEVFSQVILVCVMSASYP